jgi:hypothetical protein
MAGGRLGQMHAGPVVPNVTGRASILFTNQIFVRYKSDCGVRDKWSRGGVRLTSWPWLLRTEQGTSSRPHTDANDVGGRGPKGDLNTMEQNKCDRWGQVGSLEVVE